MHKSPPNPSDKSRLIYTFHMIEGDGARYDEKNWYVDRRARSVQAAYLIIAIAGYNRPTQCHSRPFSDDHPPSHIQSPRMLPIFYDVEYTTYQHQSLPLG